MAKKITAKTEVLNGLDVTPFPDALAWETWLATHHTTAKGLWLKIAKKGSGIDSVDYAQALDVALCYGWIDGQKGSYDETFWLQRFTPRGPRSTWSQVNRVKVSALITAGRMQPAGLAVIDAAKSDGRWEAAYAPQSTITVPADLLAALAADPPAAACFATLPASRRYAVLYRIHDAKRPETRARRIATFVELLARGEHPGR